MEENGINCVYILLLTISFSSFLSLGTQLTKAYVAITSWYRLYYENKGLLNIHTEGEGRGLVYSMNPCSNCISGLYSTFWVGCPYWIVAIGYLLSIIDLVTSFLHDL